MRRNPESNSGPHTSPGTPEYGGDTMPKTWSSERVPLAGGSSKRHINAATLIPFNSGRTLPSKWEDAERWITSPISNQVAFKNSTVGHTGPPNHSPIHEDGDEARSFVWRSTSAPGLSDLVGESSRGKEANEEEAQAPSMDMATQTSPTQDSTRSSSLRENLVTKDDARDVRVDKESRRMGLRKNGENTSKFQREEAKINAWENLQKAKAEAAIRKLEMKLEKRRFASMDKITNKLRGAEMKAQAMREFLPSDRARENPHKGFSFSIYVRICNCFVCDKA